VKSATLHVLAARLAMAAVEPVGVRMRDAWEVTATADEVVGAALEPIFNPLLQRPRTPAQTMLLETVAEWAKSGEGRARVLRVSHPGWLAERTEHAKAEQREQKERASSLYGVAKEQALRFVQQLGEAGMVPVGGP
jgi:hypothetical protein